jgi:hypothetical protein
MEGEMRKYFDIPKSEKCIICGNNKKGDAILIPDIRTKEGHLYEAQLAHIDCLQDKLFIQDGFIICRLKENK